MSAQPNVINAPIPKALQVLIAGRVSATRSLEKGTRVTTIVTPAADEYSHPQTVEVFSKHQLGVKGDDVRQLCAVRGYLRRFEYTDKRSGEIKRGERAELSLEAIEG
jgi:hypothetical protein